MFGELRFVHDRTSVRQTPSCCRAQPRFDRDVEQLLGAIEDRRGELGLRTEREGFSSALRR